MKTPRVSDFDPNAKTPVIKSSMDNMPTIQKPTQSLEPETKRQADQSNHHKPDRAIDRTYGRPSVRRRIISRHAFEVYDDQVDDLRKLSWQEKMEGKLGSMSQMVREALDNYLKEELPKK
jgi:hypothetical protein